MTPDVRAALREALAWQIELGADEAISETAHDRFAAAPPPSPQRRAPEAAKVTPSRPRGASLPGPAQPEPPPAAARVPDIATGRTDGARPGTGPSRSAVDVATSAQDLEALATALAAWEGSDLKRGARSCVFADGRPGARVMVIGEAPGADEDRLGLPFVGRAGRLLDAMLRAIGMARDAEDLAQAVYITNILPWRPPGNRTPTESEAAAFLPFVERHIELAKPEVVFSLGNTPTKALLETSVGIKRLRGNWRRHTRTGVAILPSLHPAYLLRQPADKRLAWADLRTLKAGLDTKPTLPETEAPRLL
ncbi:MAG: uracil-DNA glycosylase [Pseudomonadota bacterium]